LAAVRLRMTEWNAQAYDRLANPMQTWGEAVLSRMDLRGDETALDLGCGSGRLTEHLLRRLPRGHVIAIDRSANMLQATRAHLEPEFGGRVEYVQSPLEDLQLDQVAELAFSNATLHWVKDHPRLFQAIFRSLKPGGWLVAQCGGDPNIRIVRERAARVMAGDEYRAYFEGWSGPWEFATPETTAARLRDAGFVNIETSRFEAPVQMAGLQETRDYLTNVILGTHLERIPSAALKAQFVETLAQEYARDEPPFRFDYWRMNLSARRPPA
jgi:trans-aconitate 2-methyltransferase